jgi:hypothetical protein
MSRGWDDDRGDVRGDDRGRAATRPHETRDPGQRSCSLPDGRFSLPAGVDRQAGWGRDHRYRLRDTESHTLVTVATFQVVFDRDLREGRYRGDEDRLNDDLRSLTAQGLLESRTISTDAHGHHMRVVALTDAGRDLLDDYRALAGRRARDPEPVVHAGFRKHADLVHNASLYRMYQVEAAAIEHRGGTIRRVDLEDDLKREVYQRVHLTRGLSDDLREHRLADAARACWIRLPRNSIREKSSSFRQDPSELRLRTRRPNATPRPASARGIRGRSW